MELIRSAAARFAQTEPASSLFPDFLCTATNLEIGPGSWWLNRAYSMTNDTEQTVQPSIVSRLTPKTGHGWMMAICCVFMLLGATIVLVASKDDITAGSGLSILLPLAGCLVMHLFMHRLMGHTNHHAARRGGSELQSQMKADGKEPS